MMGRFVNALWFLLVFTATVELVTSQESTVVRTTKEFSKALYDTRIDVIYLQHPLTVSGEEWGFVRPDIKRRVEIRPLELELTEDFVLDLGGGFDLAFVSGPSGELHFRDLQLHGIYRLALGGSGTGGIMNLFRVNAPQSIHIHNSICCFLPEVCTSISDDLKKIVPSLRAALSALARSQGAFIFTIPLSRVLRSARLTLAFRIFQSCKSPRPTVVSLWRLLAVWSPNLKSLRYVCSGDW
ncbi:hypothetical protein BSKO_02634 [Bryopsis sp. KO-2023]|nr:hypothetical protein BSKO_02634 [Bryopsis sp. KO-2023]